MHHRIISIHPSHLVQERFQELSSTLFPSALWSLILGYAAISFNRADYTSIDETSPLTIDEEDEIGNADHESEVSDVEAAYMDDVPGPDSESDAARDSADSPDSLSDSRPDSPVE